ncbi:MAG: hypothetical protein V1661_01580 [bacterium]
MLYFFIEIVHFNQKQDKKETQMKKSYNFVKDVLTRSLPLLVFALAIASIYYSLLSVRPATGW